MNHYYLKKQIRQTVQPPVLLEQASSSLDEASTPAVRGKEPTFNIDLPDNAGLMNAGSQGSVALAGPRFGQAAVQLIRWAGVWVGVVAIFVGGLALQRVQATFGDRLIGEVEIGSESLKQAGEAIKNGDLTEADKKFIASEKSFLSAANQIFDLGQGTAVFSGLPYYRQSLTGGQKVISSGLLVARSGRALVDGILPIVKQFDNPAMASVGHSQQTLGKIIGQSAQAATSKLALAKQYAHSASIITQSLSSEEVPIDMRDQVASAVDQVGLMAAGTDLLATVGNHLPDLLGFNNPRSYLLLFQNNRELRATGGFLGSYAKIVLNEGEISDITVDDSHRLDGQIGYSPLALPDPMLAVTTAEKGLGFRDANWDPDFANTAKAVNQLYERGGGGTVDGVIAITPAVVEAMLDIFGGIYLPEHDLYLTKDNFVTEIQNEIEVISRNTAAPKQVLVELQPILMNRLLAASPAELSRLGKVMVTLLQQKHILISLNQPAVNTALTSMNWTGGIIAADKDYLMVVRSNLGGRKSSQTTKADYDYLATILADGSIASTLTMTFTNMAENIFPNGDNKDYIRVLLPKGAKVTSVAGQDNGTSIDQYDYQDKTVVGLWLTTPVQRLTEVSVNYLLPNATSSQYSFIAQKQAGADNQSLTVRVLGAEAGGSKVLFDGDWLSDLRLELN